MLRRTFGQIKFNVKHFSGLREKILKKKKLNTQKGSVTEQIWSASSPGAQSEILYTVAHYFHIADV